MSLYFQLAFLAFVCVVPVYMYAFVRFYGIIRLEQLDWVKRRGSLSFFYDALPRAFDPNVTLEVIRVAYSSRVGQLHSPLAVAYAKRIRVLLPLGIVLFLVALIGAAASAP